MLITIYLVAGKFKIDFEAARLFNNLVREEKLEGLVYAEVIEDKEEIVVDDPDKNKTADADGAGAEEGDDQWECQVIKY